MCCRQRHSLMLNSVQPGRPTDEETNISPFNHQPTKRGKPFSRPPKRDFPRQRMACAEFLRGPVPATPDSQQQLHSGRAGGFAGGGCDPLRVPADDGGRYPHSQNGSWVQTSWMFGQGRKWLATWDGFLYPLRLAPLKGTLKWVITEQLAAITH